MRKKLLLEFTSGVLNANNVGLYASEQSQVNFSPICFYMGEHVYSIIYMIINNRGGIKLAQLFSELR
jgi:hypothetical protein